jgi:hypothetical protein
MERLSFRTSRFWLLPLLLVAGCASNVANLLTPPEGAVAQRELQTRQLETPDEGRVLAVCAVLLQDMGFQVDEAAAALGVLSASKVRDANRLTEGERIAVTILTWGLIAGGYTAPLALFTMDAGSPKPVNIDVGITTRKVEQSGGRVSVSVTFKENSQHVTEPAVYHEFFDRLSTALFLEARES